MIMYKYYAIYILIYKVKFEICTCRIYIYIYTLAVDWSEYMQYIDHKL